VTVGDATGRIREIAELILVIAPELGEFAEQVVVDLRLGLVLLNATQALTAKEEETFQELDHAFGELVAGLGRSRGATA
jgi:hypothetical protein